MMSRLDMLEETEAPGKMESLVLAEGANCKFVVLLHFSVPATLAPAGQFEKNWVNSKKH